MPAWLAFAALGAAQLFIYWVMRSFVRRAVVGEPSPFLRVLVTAVGVIAGLFFLAAGYLYFMEPPA